MKYRVCVVGIVQNSVGEVLLCRQAQDRGVYAGQWALPGGGIDTEETMYKALEREIMEEVGLEIENARPFTFDDDVRVKIHPDKDDEEVYMIYLLFDCIASSTNVKLNDEFDDFSWVGIDDFNNYELNEATVKTFERKGWL